MPVAKRRFDAVPAYRSNWAPFKKLSLGTRVDRTALATASRLVLIARAAKGMK